MPAPKIPDPDELVALMRAGKSNAECLAFLAEEYHLAGDDLPSSAALSNLRSRRQCPPDPTTAPHRALIPWRLEPEHKMLFPAKMLRAEGRVRRGEELTGRLARDHALWRKRLESGDLAGKVVHYNPEIGFAYVDRAPGDSDLIHAP